SEFGVQNKRYSEMTPEERRRHYQEMVAAVSQSAEAVGELKTNFDRYPGRIRFTVDIADWAIRDGDYLYFSIPSSIASAFYLRADRRENPLFLETHRHIVEDISIECPPGFMPVIVPDGISIDGVGGTQLDYDVDVNEAKGGGVDIYARAEWVQRPVVVPMESYEELLKLNAKLTHRKASTVVLKREDNTRSQPVHE
ncbi:MAG: hypothetical protein O3C57_05520, partial [Verrucomicrobia bacterium]|nr:hypothetical protein [Verrucomicrobiota bacterium]